MPPDVIDTLEQILEAAGHIDSDTAGMNVDAFTQDRRTRQAVERNFEIIGEAVNRLRRHTPEIAERISSSNQIVGFRNQLMHGYDRIDYPTVWRAVRDALPSCAQKEKRFCASTTRPTRGRHKGHRRER